MVFLFDQTLRCQPPNQPPRFSLLPVLSEPGLATADEDDADGHDWGPPGQSTTHSRGCSAGIRLPNLHLKEPLIRWCPNIREGGISDVQILL